MIGPTFHQILDEKTYIDSKTSFYFIIQESPYYVLPRIEKSNQQVEINVEIEEKSIIPHQLSLSSANLYENFMTSTFRISAM